MASILDLKNFSSLVAKRPEEENWFQRYLYSLISKYTSHTHYQWIIAFKVISKYCSAPILWKLVGGKREGRKSWKTWWMSLSAGGDDAVPVPVQGMMQRPTFFSWFTFSSSSPLFSFSSVLFKITSLYSPPPCSAPRQTQTPCHPLYRPCRSPPRPPCWQQSIHPFLFLAHPSRTPWPGSPTTMTRGIEQFAHHWWHQMKYRIYECFVTAPLIVQAIES